MSKLNRVSNNISVDLKGRTLIPDDYSELNYRLIKLIDGGQVTLSRSEAFVHVKIWKGEDVDEHRFKAGDQTSINLVDSNGRSFSIEINEGKGPEQLAKELQLWNEYLSELEAREKTKKERE